MSANFNQVLLMGNMTRDIEVRYTPSNTAVGQFTLAVNRTWTTPQGEKREEVSFLDCEAWGKAVEILKRARAKFPDVPQITTQLAVALSAARQHTAAMTTFAEARAQAESNHEELLDFAFYFQYGAAAERAGLMDKAEELLKQSIELDSNKSAIAFNYLGYSWVDRGINVDEGGVMIKKALEMDPDNASYLDSLGWYHFKKAEYDHALKVLLRAAEAIKPEDAVVFDHIADTYQAMGKTAEALQYWQKAVALSTDDQPPADKISEKIEAAKQKVSSSTAPKLEQAPAPAN